MSLPFQIFAYSTVIAPTAILIIGVLLFFYKPIHRQTIGIILVALGAFGILIYSGALYISLTVEMEIMDSMLYMAQVVVEVLTLVTGIISLTHARPKQNHPEPQQTPKAI